MWFIDPELKFATPELQQTAELWRAKCGTRTMPSRDDMTIRDLAFTLPNVGFADVVREGDDVRFRIRLMGSALDEFFAPMTGKFLDQAVPAHFADKWSAQWLPVVEQRAPQRIVSRVEFGERRWYIAEALHAPLGNDGETPDVLMLVTHLHTTEGFENRTRDIAEQLQRELAERVKAAG
jgi:hypothetical protein